MLNLYCVNTVGSGKSCWRKFGSVYCWLLRIQTHKYCHYFHLFKSRYFASLMYIMLHLVPVDITISKTVSHFMKVQQNHCSLPNGIVSRISKVSISNGPNITWSKEDYWILKKKIAPSFNYMAETTRKQNCCLQLDRLRWYLKSAFKYSLRNRLSFRSLIS